MSPTTEEANLARIRDNQRRSRARRKEYLQELEARLRLCQLQGIEASAEIQKAARKVAEENKKLRMLLNSSGVDDGNIDAFLRSSVATPCGNVFPTPQQYAPSTRGTVQVLESLLEPREPAFSHLGHPMLRDQHGNRYGDDVENERRSRTLKGTSSMAVNTTIGPMAETWSDHTPTRPMFPSEAFYQTMQQQPVPSLHPSYAEKPRSTHPYSNAYAAARDTRSDDDRTMF